MLQWRSWFLVYHRGFWLFSFSYAVQFLTYSFLTVHILTCWIFLKTKIHNTHIIIPAYTESVYVYRPSDRSERKRKNRKTKKTKNDCNLVVYDDTICGERIEWWFVIRFFFFFLPIFFFFYLVSIHLSDMLNASISMFSARKFVMLLFCFFFFIYLIIWLFYYYYFL